MAIASAILKYRLYEIDVVINRAVVFGTLAVFITLVYMGLVVGVGTLVGNQRSPLLSAVAAAIVALAFQPVRVRARRLANRLVYGKRATPYEVLSEFAERIAGDVLVRGRAAANGADRRRRGWAPTQAVVWLRVGDELRPRRRGRRTGRPSAVPIADARRRAAWSPDRESAVPVRYAGELLGAISVIDAA